MGKKENDDEERESFPAVRIEETRNCKDWNARKYTHALVGSDQKVVVLKGVAVADKKIRDAIDKKIKSSAFWQPDKSFHAGLKLKDFDPILSGLVSVPFVGTRISIATYTEGSKRKSSGFDYLLKLIIINDKILTFPTPGLLSNEQFYYSIDDSNYILSETSCRSCDAWQALQTFRVTKDKVELFATDMLYGEAAD